MKKYLVTLKLIEATQDQVEVEAESPEAAGLLAVERAESLEFQTLLDSEQIVADVKEVS